MTLNSDNEGLTSDRKGKEQVVNSRRTVRYIRKDIKVHIRKQNWFSAIGGHRFRKEISVELLDISNRGCLIASLEKLAVRSKIIVLLTFETARRFEIEATVVRKAEGVGQYGIKFAAYNNELGDYMLKTQEKLTFK
ncbi:PilZ domain-containing protein [Methylomicrobium sp. RS1]|jgi:hypothetical protein|uniref:PilZ domain-containing protein n=1 Tax=Candidatus Methylomicrobium oryzae TaxID=2802053 RepID=UPI0019249414|nr:PilZ domain-containing protein [Methylomicrobium sp. RS1]MBL1263868.1 PilZ domain-containing protein [Methylomicrobium sp. RS1]